MNSSDSTDSSGGFFEDILSAAKSVFAGTQSTDVAKANAAAQAQVAASTAAQSTAQLKIMALALFGTAAMYFLFKHA